MSDTDTTVTGGDRKLRTGTVVSDAMEKTVVVSVERQFPHPLYGKRVTRESKFYAHDEGNEYRIGDIVRIEETRPLSKKKRWRVTDLMERPDAARVESPPEEEIEV